MKPAIRTERDVRLLRRTLMLVLLFWLFTAMGIWRCAHPPSFHESISYPEEGTR